MRKSVVWVLVVLVFTSFKQDYSFQIARLKYNGGGDWYANRTALPNLIRFCNKNIGTNIDPQEAVVDPSSGDIYNYPYVYMTGHGNVIFSDKDAENLRRYLIAGGFLHIDDNYGLDPFIRPQLKRIFPELELVELPLNHPVYHQKYDFANGLPKIHKHDGKPPRGFGLLYEGRLVCFYDTECDLGNGWEDYGIYPEDTEETRQKAFKMGANILQFVFIR
jgi:hypothetical protein